MKEVIAYLHTHWDREWYREFQEFRLRLIEVFDEILELLVNNTIPSFYFDGQVSALEDYLEIRPEKTEIIKNLIKSKRLYIGPFYCSSDSFLVSGECLKRNLQIGMEIAKSFGESDFTGYIADSFGHSKDIPKLLTENNISSAFLWRGLGDFKADLSWQNINVTNLLQGYFQDFLHSSLSINQKAENLKKYLDKISINSSNVLLLPIGADHLACAKNIISTLNELNNIYTDYKIIFGSPFDYLKKISIREKVDGEFLDNSKTFLLKGVYSSRPYIKRANAQAQWLLTKIAEPLNNLASSHYGIKSRKSELNFAFKELIKNQAHDSIYGCCIDEAMDDVVSRYRTVITVANGIIKRITRDLECDNGDFSIINLSNYKYSGKIFLETEKILPPFINAVKVSSRKGFTDKKLYNINDIPITEDITQIHTYLIDVQNINPFSVTKILPEHICSNLYLKVTNNSIENNYIKIEIEKNQINVTDKISQEKYNNFIKIINRADIGDSYNFGALKNDREILAKIISAKVVSNHIKAELNVILNIDIPINSTEKGRTKSKNKCKIKLNFILYNQSKMAEISAKWINKSRNHILQIGFNLKNKIYSTISEDLFSTVERFFNPDYDIYKYIPAKRGTELKTNTAPLQRFVNAQNLTLITKGINEYEIHKNTLFLTMLRATGIISNPKNPCRGTPAGPPLVTPMLQCLGENYFNLAFTFTCNEKTMYELADEFYNTYVCLFSNLKPLNY